jgi:hypothetical protein
VILAQKTHKIIHELAKGQVAGGTGKSGAYSAPLLFITNLNISLQRTARTIRGPRSDTQVLYTRNILYLRSGRSPPTYHVQSTPKMVRSSSWPCHIHGRSSSAGNPITEARTAGHPPRILNAEEQEKMRTVCRVRAHTLRDISMYALTRLS